MIAMIRHAEELIAEAPPQLAPKAGCTLAVDALLPLNRRKAQLLGRVLNFLDD